MKDKVPKDMQRPEKDLDQSRDSRVGTTPNRRSVKDDSNLWSGVRQNRTSTLEYGDRTYRRNGERAQDRDKEGGHGNRPLRGFDNHRRDGDREGGPEGIGRGRNEPSWYRDDVRPEDEDLESREATKSKDRREKDRRGTRGSDLEWNRAPKAEMDPEWMNAPESEARSPPKTLEDFERWHASVKAGSNGKPGPPADRPPGHDRNVSGTGASMTKTKIDNPLVLDSSDDKFYGLWDDGKIKGASANPNGGIEPDTKDLAAKPSKSSKFTGFWNSKSDAEPPKQIVSQPSAPPAILSQEDKEGFDRVLMLLEKQQQSSEFKPEDPPIQQAKRREPPPSPPPEPRNGQENKDLLGLFGQNPQSRNNLPQNKDSEFLLNLMRRPHQEHPNSHQVNLTNRPINQDTPAGLLPFPNLMVSPHDTPQQIPSRGPPPGYREEVQARDKLNPGIEKRGPPPGLSNENIPRQMSAGPQSSSFPAGLSRPPGFDSLPPGYQHLPPQRHNMAPPPGFPAPPRTQNTFPPGFVLNDRPRFGTPATGRGSMPSPGFMQPPPPGFPMPFSQDGLPFGAFSDGGGGFGQQGFPQQRRQ